jgi:SWI/SNF-related matrix-associated actin-dependent regulator of chromatin subfamily A3
MQRWLQLKSYSHLDGSIKALKFHGTERRSLALEIETADIVLTTYNTLSRDFDRKGAPPSLLHSVEWYRVVLDEGLTYDICGKG